VTTAWPWLLAPAAVLCCLAWVVVTMMKRRHVMLWLPGWMKGDWAGRRERRAIPRDRPTHIFFCIADHFEPAHAGAPAAVQMGRVDDWVGKYPEIFGSFRDADGRPPRHTFFYPAEQYRPEHLDGLVRLVERGFAEVEVHLHHRDDTASRLREKLEAFLERLRSHGLAASDRGTDRVRFAFIHGNWALDNALPDGDWCGVNDELRVLRDVGCYADFTLPAAPSAAQTRRINSIYYATDDPRLPRSHEDGVEVRVGGQPSGDLMIVQGPLNLRWPGRRAWGLLPSVEAGDISAAAPPEPARVDAWVRTRVCVSGRPDWVFVKVHTHGCSDRNRPVLLGERTAELHRYLGRRYNDGTRYLLHYVTAREMYNLIKAAERGLSGPPGRYRDLLIAPPGAVRGRIAASDRRRAER